MNEREDGGDAFPMPEDGWPGMAIRDFFAAFALGGLVAADKGRASFGVLAALAYEAADAMVEARESEE